MILRSILLLGVGAAFACATPALAAGTVVPAKTETAAAAQPQAVAALEAETPKAAVPAVKKSVAKSTKKKVAKAKSKKKVVAAVEAKPEKPGGLFAALFGGGIKDENAKAKQKTAKAAPAKPIVKVKAKEKVQPIEQEPVEFAISGNRGELRSEKQAKPTLFAGLFGGGPTMLPETRALDSVLERKTGKEKV